MHSSKTIDESSGLAKKPEIITFYNATKAKQLMDEQLQYRATILSLPKNIKTRLNIYGYKPTLQVGEQRVRASGRCQFCDRQRDRKTTKVCTNCAKLICRDHLVEVCPECFSEM
ncbi:unnamed protein product [Macrosiphum euphorbiae]|uniref:PiggyBac transposable element-derived protein 4 C-terminal zinc-ribbon domain-containing protein n=1 Tax=Macrosiphum euphorbiae TaxID=13131 RepID=A0AAV0WK81_9HEMI|nr:unnamed protein product [Macrosiphum euphorbiae]